jgi:hypothetical protein
MSGSGESESLNLSACESFCHASELSNRRKRVISTHAKNKFKERLGSFTARPSLINYTPVQIGWVQMAIFNMNANFEN